MRKIYLSGPSIIKVSHSDTHNPDVGDDRELKLKLFFILMLVILVGCNKENDGVVIEIHKEQHVNYLQNYGWSIDRFASETKYAYTLQSFKSHVKDIKELGHVDLTRFWIKKLQRQGTSCKRKQRRTIRL